MSRIALGLAALSLAALTACGSTPGTTPMTPPTTAETAPTPLPATPASASPDATATATATPDHAASPTATPTATPTASPTATPTTVSLPQRVESFERVEQRSENGMQIGSYYSDSLKTVVEVRVVRDRPVRELVTSMGGTNPTNVGPALCSTQGDTICAQERDGLTVAVVAKELPATMVATLTARFVDAVS